MDLSRERKAEIARQYTNNFRVVRDVANINNWGGISRYEEAVDLVQHAALKILESGRDPASIDKNYWVSAARNKALDAARRRKLITWEPFNPKLPEHDRQVAPTDPAQEVVRQEAREITRQAMDNIPPNHKNILEMYYFQEQSVQQIAGILGKSEEAVKQLLVRSRRSFKTAYQAIDSE